MRPAVHVAASRLRIDSATAQVVRALDAVGVQSILLKGASNRRWLGTAAERGYADCDLLIAPEDREMAERVLSSLGFKAELDVARMPPWWREHGVAWVRDADLAVIDVHRTLPGVGVDDRRAWQLLSTGTEEIIIGGYPTRALAVPARAMHVALHAAHHGPSDSTGVGELSRALERADVGTWREATALAQELGALDAFLAGLRIVPAGRHVAAQLGIDANPSLEIALVGEASRASALTLERFVHAGSVRTRLSMIRYKLVPPDTFIRRWSPLAQRGVIGLMIAYAWRPVWVLIRVPAAVRTWRKARRRRD
jgi:hypothetical protein